MGMSTPHRNMLFDIVFPSRFELKRLSGSEESFVRVSSDSVSERPCTP